MREYLVSGIRRGRNENRISGHGIRKIERKRENSLQDVRRLFIYRASTHRHAWSHARVHGALTVT